jgi:hypothetical protein
VEVLSGGPVNAVKECKVTIISFTIRPGIELTLLTFFFYWM